MDRECVSLLPRVCEVLADSGRSLPDDTSLEKLLDWFTGLALTGGSLLEDCPCLLDFISSVVYNAASEPAVLSFTLKLTGLLATSENGFKRLQECAVLNLVFNLQHWQEKGLWEDPCVRIGWIQGLKNLLQHPKALSFFVKSGFTEPLLQLQTDPSLFVASAANQTLAHILLFFQPASSAEFNGADKDDRMTFYTDAVTATSRYLIDSLVPKDSTQLHQSVQILKLLALVLAQAGPPLRDTLLRAVTDSLEELVTACYSQLTLPLMDVILAAHSSIASEHCAEQRVNRLLSSMLTANKPPDLLHAAAAFLHSGHRDAVHVAQAVRIVLLPLNIITGQPLPGATDDDQRFSMVEQLKIKSSCISMICLCLKNTPQITMMPSDVLPCPPDSAVTAVLSVLKICSGISSSGAHREVCRNVIGSGKVQKYALDALTALSCSPGVKEKITDVFSVLTCFLDNPHSEPTVIHKSYKTLVKWASVCPDPSIITDLLRQDLDVVVKKRVCDVRWEVRDSTVEFLGNLAGERAFMKEECDSVLEGLLSPCCTTSLLKEALQDTESYVRASAISALARTLAHSWQQGAALSQKETEIVSRLLEILSQDTEGFSRRAVVQYFIAWFSSRPSHSSSSLLMNCVRTVLSQGSADLDWEVKVYTLELAELLLDKAFSGHQSSVTRHALTHPYGVVLDQTSTLHTHTGSSTEGEEPDLVAILNNMVEQGVISVLLSGLVDCDRPVGLKSCRLLISLREMVCTPLSSCTLDAAGVSFNLPDCGWGLEIRKILDLKKNDGTSEAHLTSSGRFSGTGDPEDCCEGGGTVDVWQVLRSLGLDEKLDILTQSSDHIHNSPRSLLQDILTASAPHIHTERESGQEVIVDCY